MYFYNLILLSGGRGGGEEGEANPAVCPAAEQFRCLTEAKQTSVSYLLNSWTLHKERQNKCEDDKLLPLRFKAL